ncbi:MAG TPA: protease, partial [Candidatus Desulfofervidus auxilii]|nr:protease [Candidatus Desulfofervidus auxilii]
MAKKIGILVADLYQDLEVWYPLLRLREAGIEVTVIGAEKNKVYKSKHGYEIKSDISAKEIKAETLDGLIIPG